MKTPTVLLAALGIAMPAGASVVAEPQPSPQVQEQALPEGEQRLRAGIVMLGKICQCMAEITDKDTAEAAVSPLMRLNGELRSWAQSFSSLPPLSEPEAIAYEEKYLPIIRKINRIIETHGERLAAAEYYGSLNLPAALVHLAQIYQN